MFFISFLWLVPFSPPSSFFKSSCCIFAVVHRFLCVVTALHTCPCVQQSHRLSNNFPLFLSRSFSFLCIQHMQTAKKKGEGGGYNIERMRAVYLSWWSWNTAQYHSWINLFTQWEKKNLSAIWNNVEAHWPGATLPWKNLSPALSRWSDCNNSFANQLSLSKYMSTPLPQCTLCHVKCSG